MSTLGAGSGKERSNAIYVWIVMLVVAFAVLVVNAWLSTDFADKEANARNIVADVRVLSQQIAKAGQDAASGGVDAFDELGSARARIRKNLETLNNGSSAENISAYRGAPGITVPLARLGEAWAPMDAAAGRILDNKEMVLGLTETAQKFTESVPLIQAEMDEVVRAMGESGNATFSQLSTAYRQVVLADRMLRHVAQILQGGAAAGSAGDRLSRDAMLFSQVLSGLQEGLPEQNIRRIDSPAARQSLARVSQIYSEVQPDVEAILNASNDLIDVKESANQISLASADLLQGAENLNQAFIKLPEGRMFPSVYAGIGAGVLAIIAIIGLLYTLYKDQSKRFRVTQELNQRNQEAILRLLDEMGSLAEGDLTVRATVTEDITGAIADSINFAVEALRSLVTTINETAVQVAAAAQETQATAMHLAEAAEHQAQQITSASAAINEIAVSIDEVSKNSAESADVAQRSVQIAAKGAEVVRQTIQGMDSIRDQIQETSKRIKRLGESSQEIGSIVELINDIAEQTNILALNAAIQAASAGEAGRGFAVVADEVQRLAERSASATKRIETLVQTIQADTNEAVSSMEQTTAEVVAGARLAEDAGLALGEIETVSNDLADLIQNISEAARQQSAAATNISATMNVIQEITTQTSVGASQTAESIGNLAQLAADLRRSVADFKLPG
ncbi:MAG: methyl-accepting chemotaxis protein [Lysobacteraceae bacterium]